jgi:hypothetical protein
MPRVEAPAAKKTAEKKPTARQRRIQQATASVTTSEVAPARRGEQEEPEVELQQLEEAAAAVVPHQADVPATPSRSVLTPTADQVVTAGEEENPFEFVKPSEDLDPLEQVGLARRGIARANRGLENGLGRLQKGYVTSAGEYLWWVTQGTRLKDAGFKSVARFGEALGLSTQDIYRLRRAVPIHRIIGDMIDGALNERTYRELYTTIVDEKGEIPVTEDGEPNVSPARQQLLREQFTEMKRLGKITSTGAVEARKLLMLGKDVDIIEIEPGSDQGPGAIDQLAKARRTNRILPLEVLREAKEKDPDAVQQYVEDLKRAYEAAAEIVG